ncbi:hypothetical protein AgCh_026194 [Apium graveolens]
MEKLNNQEERVSTKANAEKNNGKTLYANVPKWQTDVEEFQRSAVEFLDKYKNRASWRCIHFLPIPKPVSRFRLGREAAHKVKRVTELSDSGKDILANEIAYLLPRENVPPTDTVFQDFESRKGAYMKLWEALVTEGSSSILGIYGMPGVGKTRMMEQAWKEAKEKGIFTKVARADVGNDELNVIKLQRQIADHLGCHLESQDNLLSRASQLKSCLMNGGKVLIILDDVWREIPFDVIGIPSVVDGSCKGLKILLTSRKKDVCLRNNCKHPIKITTLTEDEAWTLFRNTVGVDSMHDISMAHKVCEKCAGLPLLICSVGKALQFATNNSWKDALSQLEKGTVENIAGIDPKVYACVKLSIDRLPNDAKSCLFLCSLYPEDAVIFIRKLIQIATGSQLVLDEESRVCTMVDFLRSSSLLLGSVEDASIKLHDLIRDVARSMAVSDPKYAFSLVRCGSQLPDNPDYCTRRLLHLHLEKNDFRFSDGLVFPNLHKLWLQCNNHLQLSGGFFSMFVNLRFLLIEGKSSSLELQLSLHSLCNLRTLILDKCGLTHVKQTNVGFFPENLETLCFWNCQLPVPLDLPNLGYLRKLEIEGNRVKMLPNTISSLPNLEELHIPSGISSGFDRSSDAVAGPILAEISRLIGLKSLRMIFRNSEPFQNTNIFDNLLEYDIYVSNNICSRHLQNSGVSIKRSVELYDIQLEGLESLIERAEKVTLYKTYIDVGSIWNSNNKAFSDLRDLYISECKTMEYIARISQDEIRSSCQLLTSFSKLTNLEITSCSSLKYIFSKSVAGGLVQLQVLSIYSCPSLESIVTNEDKNNGDIMIFSKLKVLCLSHLPRLKSFYRENEDRHASTMDSRVQSQRPFFHEMVAFPSLEDLSTWEVAVSELWGKYYCDGVSSFCKLKKLRVWLCDEMETVIPPAMLNRMRDLETIRIWNCKSLRNVFPPCIARDLIHLKSMEVDKCELLTEIIGVDEQEITDGIVFPELSYLCLDILPNFTSFRCYQTGEDNNYKVQFPNLVNLYLVCKEIKLGAKDDFTCQQLERLRISNCGYSIALALSVFRSLQQLQELEICASPFLEEIVEDVRGGEASDMDKNTITLPRLKYFTLEDLPNLKSCILNSNYECHMPALTKVKVANCGISALFTFSALRSLPQLQELEISNCSKLGEIVEGARGDESSGMDKKTITLFQLRSLILLDLPNLESLISNATYECQMPALTKVEIDNCGVSTLFTCSISRKLQQLTKLDVSNCRWLKSIVDDVGNDETSSADDTVITFSGLTELHLLSLPSLKCFSSTSSYTFSMPKLNDVAMESCSRMEYFTLLKASMPMARVSVGWMEWENTPA